MLWAIWCWCFERLNPNLDQQLHNYQNVSQFIEIVWKYTLYIYIWQLYNTYYGIVTTDLTQIETLWILLNISKMICFLKFGERASHEDVWMILISRSSIIHLFKPSKSCPFQTIVCKSAAQQKNNSINSWWIKTSNLNCRMQMSSQLFTWTVKNNKSWNTGWYRATNHCFEYLTNL